MEEYIDVFDTAGQRLDIFLSKKFSQLSRTKIRELIAEGKVTVNSLIKRPSFKVCFGMKIKIELPETKPLTLEPFSRDIQIIYEDSDVIVVDKPQGINSHPPREGMNDSLINCLIYMGKELAPINPLRPGIVHRLDKETSGAMVIAKTNQAYLSLTAQFRRRLVKKEYRAIVWGKIEKDNLKVDLPLARDTSHRLRMKVSFINAKAAVTELNVLERFGASSYVSLRIHTGRMHQIRVHMKFLGFPIVGDKKYGIKDNYSELFLHAYKLGFYHPATNEFKEFVAPIPERFTEFIKMQGDSHKF